MLVTTEYFPSLRAAEERALTDALERQRVVAERLRLDRPARGMGLRRLVSRSRQQVQECCSQLEEACADWQARSA
ncbi:hypothetical protein [Naasia sp. SYSU D00948]|uniref:hypothetical protein n=1 Tax=Naasia sp. SYSU D00948 TaxID=2817379 RepID=UPI001B3032FB|nr:hypothetical protein [Naasia sp. SYSU D00948]